MPSVKITVLKKTTEEDLFEEYAHEECEPVCSRFDLDEEFIVDGEELSVPEGFCPYAWDSVSSHIKALILGGNFDLWNWTEDDKTAIVCCPDGLKPVFFKLELE